MIHFLSRSLFEWHLFDFENPPSADGTSIPPPQWYHFCNSPWCMWPSWDLVGLLKMICPMKWLLSKLSSIAPIWNCMQIFLASKTTWATWLWANTIKAPVITRSHATWIFPSSAPSQVSITFNHFFSWTFAKKFPKKIHPMVQKKTHKIHSKNFQPKKDTYIKLQLPTLQLCQFFVPPKSATSLHQRVLSLPPPRLSRCSPSQKIIGSNGHESPGFFLE